MRLLSVKMSSCANAGPWHIRKDRTTRRGIVNWLVGWLVGWLMIGWLIVWFVDWFIDLATFVFMLSFRHLKTFLLCICENISHDSTPVRHAALFALGQFSYHMQPDISKFHSELVPLLLNYLSQAVQDPVESNRKGLSRIYYALEMFCENLGNNIQTSSCINLLHANQEYVFVEHFIKMWLVMRR